MTRPPPLRLNDIPRSRIVGPSEWRFRWKGVTKQRKTYRETTKCEYLVMPLSCGHYVDVQTDWLRGRCPKTVRCYSCYEQGK
jgi:hypothetical protein